MGVALVVFSGFCFQNERGRGNPAARSSCDNTNQHPGALRVRHSNSCVWSSSGESVVLYENPSMQLARKPGAWAPIRIPSSRINSQMPRTRFSVQVETPVLTLCTAQSPKWGRLSLYLRLSLIDDLESLLPEGPGLCPRLACHELHA